MPTPTRTDAEFIVTYTEVDGAVLAAYVVKFPTSSALRDQRGAMRHSDRAAAETWIKQQASRRGLQPTIAEGPAEPVPPEA